jgi:hypothetical protein
MICELVRQGAQVGVTAMSHKVISSLLEAVMKAAKEWNLPVRCAGIAEQHDASRGLRCCEPGLWLVKVHHEGNQGSSPEEVEVVNRLVLSLVRPGAQWIDRHGTAQHMKADDILVVAPFNAQVALLEEGSHR